MRLIRPIMSALAAIALAMLMVPAGAYALDADPAGTSAGADSTIEATGSTEATDGDGGADTGTGTDTGSATGTDTGADTKTDSADEDADTDPADEKDMEDGGEDVVEPSVLDDEIPADDEGGDEGERVWLQTVTFYYKGFTGYKDSPLPDGGVQHNIATYDEDLHEPILRTDITEADGFVDGCLQDANLIPSELILDIPGWTYKDAWGIGDRLVGVATIRYVPFVPFETDADDDGDVADDACEHEWSEWSYSGFNEYETPTGYIKTCQKCGDTVEYGYYESIPCVDGAYSHMSTPVDPAIADKCYMLKDRPIETCPDCGRPTVLINTKGHDWSIETDEHKLADHPNTYGDWYLVKILCANDPTHEKWIYTPWRPEEPNDEDPDYSEDDFYSDPDPEPEPAPEPEIVPVPEPEIVPAPEPEPEPIVEPVPNREVPATGDVLATTTTGASVALALASIALIAMAAARRRR